MLGALVFHIGLKVPVMREALPPARGHEAAARGPRAHRTGARAPRRDHERAALGRLPHPHAPGVDRRRGGGVGRPGRYDRGSGGGWAAGRSRRARSPRTRARQRAQRLPGEQNLQRGRHSAGQGRPCVASGAQGWRREPRRADARGAAEHGPGERQAADRLRRGLVDHSDLDRRQAGRPGPAGGRRGRRRGGRALAAGEWRPEQCHAQPRPDESPGGVAGPEGQRRRSLAGSRFPARTIVPAIPGVHCTKWVGEMVFA